MGKEGSQLGGPLAMGRENLAMGGLGNGGALAMGGTEEEGSWLWRQQARGWQWGGCSGPVWGSLRGGLGCQRSPHAGAMLGDTRLVHPCGERVWKKHPGGGQESSSDLLPDISHLPGSSPILCGCCSWLILPLHSWSVFSWLTSSAARNIPYVIKAINCDKALRHNLCSALVSLLLSPRENRGKREKR